MDSGWRMIENARERQRQREREVDRKGETEK